MTGSTTQLQTSVSAAAPPEPPQLGEGVELLGPYQGSGFKEPRYLVRRPDGQVVQLPPVLYHVVEGAAEGHDDRAIAERLGETIDRKVSEDDVRFIVDEKLRPLGLVRHPDDEATLSTSKPDSLLTLKYKKALLPPSVVRVIAATFMPLFALPVVVAVLLAAVGLDIWLFEVHGLAQGLRAALYEPTTLLLLFALVVLSAAFHECGHAAATRYGGARPGAMGAGLYLVWPALYTDITDSYRLGRGGRLRADLGGVYFNTIFMLLTGGAYFFTGFEPLLLLIPIQQLEIAHQLLPFLRLDGYYIVSDLTGVPDILSRIKPTLKSLVPGLETDPRVRELKPWARAVVTLYLLLLVPLMLLLFSMMALAAPRVFATAWDALGVTWRHAQQAIDRREAIPSLVSLIQLAVLALPPIGLALTFARAGRRVSGGVWRGTETRPRARAVIVAATSAAATALFLSWWTNGAYRPVAAGERGTLSARVFEAHAALGHRPRHTSVTPTRHRHVRSTHPASRARGSRVQDVRPMVSGTQPNPNATSAETRARVKQRPTDTGVRTTSEAPWTSDPFPTTTEPAAPPASPTTTTTPGTTTDTSPTTTTTPGTTTDTTAATTTTTPGTTTDTTAATTTAP
jgi:putative peptide zinc metalloprotease protein